ncbi:MAG: site-specific integrase [Candidatus Marinimicrobia bacterium]|nr:site-specific integrase [Candidatus Neomarinimicrobiota bacterium]
MNQNQQSKQTKYPGVYPYGDEKWRVFWYDWDGSKKSKILQCTQKQAATWLNGKKHTAHKIKTGLEQPSGLNKGPVKFSKLWGMFSKDYKLRVKAGTIKSGSFEIYKFSYLAFKDCNPGIVNKRLTNIKESDIENFKIHRKEKNYSNDGTNTIIRNLKTIFKYAVDKELIHKSPLKSISYLPTHNRDVRFLMDEEINSLMEALNNIDENRAFEREGRDLIKFYLHTGARAKEILSDLLKWKDVQEDSLILSSSKTESSRTIIITDGIRKILSNRDRKKPGPFSIGYYGVYNRVKYILKKAKIENASIQTLRKTAGAIHYKTHRDIFATSKFLGHSSVKVTESHYVGLIQSLKTEYAIKYDKVLSDYFNISEK